MIGQIGAISLPLVIGIIVVFGFIKRVDLFSSFVTGAKQGVQTSLQILPTLLGLYIAVSMLRASGLLEMICSLIAPLADAVGISPELAPLALLRPVSGSGSSAYTISLLKTFGPDSETGRIASVISSATETTFYAVAVYFGATKYKKYAYTIPVALVGDFATIVLAILSVKWLS